MQRIKRHKNFINVLTYVLKSGSHHREAPSVIGGNMTGDCAKELIAEFNTASRLRADIVKPAWHNSLRLPQGDKLSNDQWKLIADDYMGQLGFSDTHLRCYVLHDDSVGQHIHIVANRIDCISGKVNLGRHESLKSGRIIQELEIKYNLTITKGSEPKKLENQDKNSNKVTPIKARKLSRNETMYEERTGDICNKKQLQIILDTSLRDKPDLKTFLQLLEQQGVKWTANISTTGRMSGFSFSFGGIAFKASQLGKEYSWKNLQEKLCFNPDTDTMYLISVKAEALQEEKTTKVDPFMQLAMNPAGLPELIHTKPNSQQPDHEAVSIREAIEDLSRKILSLKAQQQKPQFKRSAAPRHEARTVEQVTSPSQHHHFIFSFKPFKRILAILHRLPFLVNFKTFDEFLPEPTSRKPPKIRM